MVNYTQTCLLEDKCDTRYNLTCLTSSQTCGCLTTTTQYYNGSSCSYLLGYLGACSNSIECNQYLGLTCSSSACYCNSTQFFNGTMCGKLNFLVWAKKVLDNSTLICHPFLIIL